MRARNIKPGFFKNESLLELPPLTRILFEGLWCMADREGRLEDRPKRIKIEVLPADDCDVDAALQSLHDCDLIQRYAVNGTKYIQVTHFSKHQNPHVKEVASTIPAPCKHRANTMPAALIPDSLIPDSGFSDSGSLNPSGSGGSIAPAREEPTPEDAYNPFSANPKRPETDTVEAYIVNKLHVTPNAIMAENVDDFLKRGMPPELIRYAVDTAINAGKFQWDYARGILDNWIIARIFTVDAAKAEQARHDAHKAAKARAAPTGRGAPQKDDRADWFFGTAKEG